MVVEGYPNVLITLFTDLIALYNVSATMICSLVYLILLHDGVFVSRFLSAPPSYQGEISEAPENLINRDFHATKPNEKWLTDITEFAIKAGKVYLSPIIDCLDGMPVSWKLSTSPNADLVNTMLKDAIATLSPEEKPIIHSDRGNHYRWPEWIRIVKNAGLKRSMSRKGCSPDNAACEGFFGHLKNEMFYNHNWDDCTIPEFIKAVDDYIHWYRTDRIKSTLGGLSPLQYRKELGVGV